MQKLHFSNASKDAANCTNSWSSESRPSSLGVCRVATRMDKVNLLAQQESLAILFVKFDINIVAVRSKKFAQFAQFVVEIT
jgi:hypothetical protein